MADNLNSRIQKALNKWTGYGVAITGKRDKATIDAIKNFQRLQNMEPTGVADVETLNRLFRTTAELAVETQETTVEPVTNETEPTTEPESVTPSTMFNVQP